MLIFLTQVAHTENHTKNAMSLVMVPTELRWKNSAAF
jgi:hypothetical protein